MSDDQHIEREIDLDQPVDEVWALLATADGWRQWLVDDATIDVAVGAIGEVVDDEVRRNVRVMGVEAERSLTFQWWERDDPASASEVAIQLVDLPGGGSRVHVVERPLIASARARAAQLSVWEVRACLLALAVHALVRV